ncbi:MAG: insulinase family protein [Oscillospiraceae bacterium]
MPLDYTREKFTNGVNFTSITDKRFKTNYISVNLITELSSETAAMNAVIPSIITKSNSEYKTFSEISKKLTSLYGANLSGDIMKIGDTQALSFSASCIADIYALDNEKVTAETTELLIQCLTSPNIENGGFCEKNFALDKQELIDDIDAEINEKRSYAIMRAAKTIYAGEPAENTSHGDKEHALAITSKAAYEQYKKLLKTAQVEIFFVGGGNSEDAKSKFKTLFNSIERDFCGNYTSKISKLKPQTAEITETLDVAQSKMVMAFKTDVIDKPSFMLMNAIYGITPFSKLFLNVREKLSLCYYCSVGFDERKGAVYVDSGVEHENIQKAKDEIINQLNLVAAGDFTDDEMKNSALSIINSYKSVNDSPYSLASWYFSQIFVGEIMSPDQEIERIKKVTREQIITAAKSLKLDTLYILTQKEGTVNAD